MKTPEEIKKGLECCAKNSTLACIECPYRIDKREGKPCFDMLLTDVKELHSILNQRLAQTERERDAAVKDMERHKDCCTCKHQYNHFECGRENGCAGCPNAECHCSIGDTTEECWQWRGVCEENSKEAEV